MFKLYTHFRYINTWHRIVQNSGCVEPICFPEAYWSVRAMANAANVHTDFSLAECLLQQRLSNTSSLSSLEPTDLRFFPSWFILGETLWKARKARHIVFLDRSQMSQAVALASHNFPQLLRNMVFLHFAWLRFITVLHGSTFRLYLLFVLEPHGSPIFSPFQEDQTGLSSHWPLALTVDLSSFKRSSSIRTPWTQPVLHPILHSLT